MALLKLPSTVAVLLLPPGASGNCRGFGLPAKALLPLPVTVALLSFPALATASLSLPVAVAVFCRGRPG